MPSPSLVLSRASRIRVPPLALLRKRRKAIESVRFHGLPLAIVLLACAVAQTATLMQPINIHQWPDTAQYLTVAHRILYLHQFADPIRTPGYPAFMALVFALTGGEHLRALVVAQAGLMVLAALEVYVLAYRLTCRRWAACVIATVIGTNLFLLDWERLYLSETLSYWLIVTIFVLFERYLRSERTSTLIWLALVCAAAILTRPIFIYIPAALWLVLAFRSARVGTLRQRWKPLAFACAVSYGFVVADMAANAATFGYFGLSDISNLNLFAKVLEAHTIYGMPASGADPRFAPFQADVSKYVASGRGEIWAFVFSHPTWDAHYWSTYGAYSIQVLMRHPWYYLHASFADVMKVWTVRPWFWAPYTAAPLWTYVLIKLSILQYRAYLLLPLLLLATAIWAWRHAEQVVGVTLLAMLVCILGQLLSAGMLDYTEFDRLRLPLDWAMTFVVGMAVVQSISVGARAMLRRSGGIASIGEPAHALVPVWLTGAVTALGAMPVSQRLRKTSGATEQNVRARAHASREREERREAEKGSH
jgi:Dolichyl-phosphate-mannose-protein mannosyltransferase